jgi:hypothetical protein
MLKKLNISYRAISVKSSGGTGCKPPPKETRYSVNRMFAETRLGSHQLERRCGVHDAAEALSEMLSARCVLQIFCRVARVLIQLAAQED